MTTWYLMRASGVVSLVLLTAVLALGISVAGRLRLQGWPALLLAGLHRNLSLLAVAFLGIHVATVTVCGFVQPGTKFDPDKIAEVYQALHEQPRDKWEREVIFK